MSVKYLDEYRAVGVDYDETFTDIESAKAAMLYARNAFYPATLDSPLFKLSRSVLIGNTGECITSFDPAEIPSDTDRIRVTDTLGVTDTLLFGNILPYLQARADVIRELDVSLWGVLRKGIDDETGIISWTPIANN